MTKRNLTQLFAAVAIASASPSVSANPRTLPSGAPACGNVQMKGERVRRCTTAAPAPKPEPAKPAPTTTATQAPAVLQKLLAIFGGGAAARPRELKNGAPANGNVAGRSTGVRRPVEPPTTPTSN